MAKVRKGQPKSKDCSDCLTSAILPNMNVLVSSQWRTGTGKMKSRRSRSHIPSTL